LPLNQINIEIVFIIISYIL